MTPYAAYIKGKKKKKKDPSDLKKKKDPSDLKYNPKIKPDPNPRFKEPDPATPAREGANILPELTVTPNYTSYKRKMKK